MTTLLLRKDEHHRHRLAQGTADAQEHAAHDAVTRERQDHVGDAPPPRPSQSEGSFTGVPRGLRHDLPADRGHDRNDHDGHDEAADEDRIGNTCRVRWCGRWG